MTADGMATVTIETIIASDAHHRASLHPAIDLIATLTTGDPVTVGGQTRGQTRIHDRTAMIAVEGAPTHTGRMSLRATSLSAWTSQLASPTTCPTASRRTGARRAEMGVEVALADPAGLAGSRHPTPLNER